MVTRYIHRESSVFGFPMALALLLGISSSIPSMAASRTDPARSQPNIEDYATIEAYVGKERTPVYAFGYTYVYGLSPDLLPGVVMQEGNTNAVVKFKPKKSWEIKDNLCGSAPAREPKTMWNDDQPLLPIHLIDGDPETAWSSRGGATADRQPEWIRIDLPAESAVASVAFVCSEKGPGMETGKRLPKELTVKLSRDARQWETVYESKSFSGPNAGPSVITFDPRPAKQIWIIGDNLQPVGNWGHGFSIGEVEVRDLAGNNLALLSRGAGVQVSSTYYGYGMDRFTQDMLWPIQYDLGFKWLRVGYDMGMYLWSYVEREKGKLEIDRRADECVTEAHRNGVNVILCLDKGNWLYHNPPRKVDWKKRRTREMMETYYDHQGWPTSSPELLKGYLRYVAYMVRHFKGRVAYYEICNEWFSVPARIQDYVKLVRATIPVIKKADPNAKIMLGSTGGFDRGLILLCLGKEPHAEVRDGKLIAVGLTIAVVKGTKEKDVKVSVDARSDAAAGIILRYKDHKNYLLATYANKCIHLHEAVDSDYDFGPASKPAEGLGPDIHLAAEIKGSEVSFTVSDGVKSFTTNHRIERTNDAGAVGLFQNLTTDQVFDNFRVSDPQGKTVFEDGFNGPDKQASASWEIPLGYKIEAGLGPQLDAIGWHPWYQADPDNGSYRNYKRDVARFKKECAAFGFEGQYAATEWTWAAPYPGGSDWCTEMTKAKYSAQLMTAHSGMDIISLYNETFQTGKIDWDCNLLRNGFSADPISATQPQPIYYVLRSISTVLDGFRAAEFPVKFTSHRQLDCYTFKRGNDEFMVAAWVPGRTKDGIVEAKTDVTLPGLRARHARTIDVFNGTEQELNLDRNDSGMVVKGMFIKDYPTFIHVKR